jgi:hypothetical protein
MSEWRNGRRASLRCWFPARGVRVQVPPRTPGGDPAQAEPGGGRAPLVQVATTLTERMPPPSFGAVAYPGQHGPCGPSLDPGGYLSDAAGRGSRVSLPGAGGPAGHPIYRL